MSVEHIQEVTMSRKDYENYDDKELKALADSGIPDAIFEYAMRLRSRDENKEAFVYFYKLKDYNNSFILDRIIDIAYYEEKGIIDDKELFALMKRRHEMDISIVSYLLGHMYRQGRGTRKSLKKYIELLTLWAKAGSYVGTIELAECYEKGYGVRHSYRKAFKLYYEFRDEHGKMDYWCAYKVGYYMYHRLGGVKRDMFWIEFHLRFAARLRKEAEELYIEIFHKAPQY